MIRHVFAFLLIINHEYVNCDINVTAKNEVFMAFSRYLKKFKILEMGPASCPGF